MRLAFFSLNAYDMLTGGYRGESGGGAQLQQIHIGRELVTRGHEVHFIEYDTGNKRELEMDGIQVHTVSVPQGTAVRRAFRVTENTRCVLTSLKPDVCYRRVLDFGVIPLSWLTRLMGSQFVYGFAHDDELSENPHMFSDGIKSSRLFLKLTRHALSNASAVIAQNDHQRSLAQHRLSTSVFKIQNCYPTDEVEPVDWDFEPPVIFWAARFQPWKRPDMVADLAAEFPQATFVMAGRPGDEVLYSDLEKIANTLDNLILTGHIPLSEIDQHFAAADIFLNTSEQEGFPNTFLQAWAQGTPVVSFQADPDGIIEDNGIGLVANGSDDMIKEHLRQLIEGSEDRKERGDAGQQYFREHHTVDAVTDEYERVFEALTTGHRD